MHNNTNSLCWQIWRINLRDRKQGRNANGKRVQQQKTAAVTKFIITTAATNKEDITRSSEACRDSGTKLFQKTYFCVRVPFSKIMFA